MEVLKQLMPYIASIGAIVVGLLSVTATPVFDLSRDLAIAMIIGGFAGLGVTVAVPQVRADARRTAVAEAHAAQAMRLPPQ